LIYLTEATDAYEMINKTQAKVGMPQAQPPEIFLRLRMREVEKVFVQVAIDLKEILVLDGMDQAADPPGIRIRSHDPLSLFDG